MSANAAVAAVLGIAGAAEAIAKAATVAPEAQVLHARRRYERRNALRPRVRLRRVRRFTEELIAAHEADDHAGMAAALLNLAEHGVTQVEVREHFAAAIELDAMLDDAHKACEE